MLELKTVSVYFQKKLIVDTVSCFKTTGDCSSWARTDRGNLPYQEALWGILSTHFQQEVKLFSKETI